MKRFRRWRQRPFKKIKVARFLKSKKFLAIAVLLILFFVFTPVSLIQISQKTESWINDRAKAGVRTFEKQTGLKIKWEEINFHLFSMKVQLKNVRLASTGPAFRGTKKFPSSSYLDGWQKANKISVKPSLYSLLFKKKIILASLVIEGGELRLKALESYQRKKKSRQTKMEELPIQKMIVKNSSLVLKLNGHSLNFLGISLKAKQKTGRGIEFELAVPSFHTERVALLNARSSAPVPDIFLQNKTICNKSKMEDTKGTEKAASCQQKGDLASSDENLAKAKAIKKSFSISLKGSLREDKILFQSILLQNKDFRSLTEGLSLLTDAKGLKSLNLKSSSGTLPSFLIQEAWEIGKVQGDLPFFRALFSYKLQLKYNRRRGSQASYEISTKKALFKTEPLKSFFLKGKLEPDFLTAQRGFIQTQSGGEIEIKEARAGLNPRDSLPFRFFLQTKSLDSLQLARALFDSKDFPIQADFNGGIKCSGFALPKAPALKCSMDGQSEKLSLRVQEESKEAGAKKPQSLDLVKEQRKEQGKEQRKERGEEGYQEIASVHGMRFQADMEWKDNTLRFTVDGENEENRSKIYFKATSSDQAERLQADYSFEGKLGRDIVFKTPFPLSGELSASEGQLLIEKSKIRLQGALFSPLLYIQSFRLKNISGQYRFQNNKLEFLNIKGQPEKSSWLAECSLDFSKRELMVKSTAPFFDLKDLQYALQGDRQIPLKLKGTGAFSLFLRLPWNRTQHTEFHLKGNLFNAFVNRDFFQQMEFELGLKEGKGELKSLLLRKGRGFIEGKGSFDDKFQLDLKVSGNGLSLEKIEHLNEILPFSQAGGLNFDMEIKGSLTRPKIQSDILVSSMFLYSYPAGSSKIKLQIDEEALSFSGNITDEIQIKNFYWPFSKSGTIRTEGSFNQLDLIKILFSKNRMQKKTHDYSSQMDGSFAFTKERVDGAFWTGQAKMDKLLVSKSEKWIKSDRPFLVLLDEKGEISLSSARFLQDNDRELIISQRDSNKLFISGESSLGLFSAFFPFLEELDGNISGRLLMENNLRKMYPKGSLKIEGGALSLGPLPKFSELRAELALSKNNITISQLSGLAGGGQIEGGGSVAYDFPLMPGLDLNLRFVDSNLNIPKDFSTRGRGEIKIQGSKPPYLISGSYDIDSGLITKEFSGRGKKAKKKAYNFSFLESAEEQQNSLFELKLSFKTLQPVALSTGLIQSSVEGEADIYGPLNSLLMNGGFALVEEGLIFFRGQEFQINSGSVQFKNSAPDNPFLSVKAQTVFKEKVIDTMESEQEIEREYQIFLSLEGPSKNPGFSLKSRPSLNEREIISLLALGLGSGRLDTDVRENATDYSYQILASILLEKPLNREIKDALGLDFRLTPYINTANQPVTKVTLSKDWFKKWKSSFSQTIEDKQSDIRLKYKLNPNMSLTAFWESATDEEINVERDREERMGLDLEFNLDF